MSADNFRKTRTWIILLAIAVMLRCYHEAMYLQMDSDYGIQLEAARNWIEGKGLCNVRVDPVNLGQAQLIPLEKWPVLYPMFLGSLKFITGNWFVAVWISQAFATLLLLYSFLKLLNVFNPSQSTRNMFMLFFAVSPVIPYYWSATDILTTALFLLSARIALKPEQTIRDWVIIGALSGMSALIRFACIPNLAIFPFFFFMRWFFTRQRWNWNAVLVILLVSSVITFGFYSIYPIGGGRTGFLHNLVSLNLYWEHLKWFDSFPIKSLFYLSPVEYRLPVNQPGLITFYRVTLHLLSAGLLILFFIRFIRIDRVHRFLNSTAAGYPALSGKLILLFISAACVIAGFLIIESLATEPEANSFGPPWMPPVWTFVYSNRYFAFLIILIQLFFFISIDRSSDKPFLRNSFRFIYFTSIVYSIIFFLFTQYQIYAPHGNGGATCWSTYGDDLTVFNMISKLEEEGRDVVYASHQLGENAPVTVVSGADPVRDYNRLIQGMPSAPEGVTLLVEMPVTPDTAEDAFIRRNGLQKVLTFDGSALYRKDF